MPPTFHGFDASADKDQNEKTNDAEKNEIESMKSMTGFGQARSSTAGSELDVVIRAVNGRFLEIRFHLPREMMKLESEIKRRIEQKFARGTIDIYISRRAKALKSGAKIHVNEDLAKEYVKALASVSKILGGNVKKGPAKSGSKNSAEKKLGGRGSAEILPQWSPESLLRMPDVAQLQEAEFDLEDEKKFILQAVDGASEICLQERLREGKSLQKDLLRKHGELTEVVQKIWATRDFANQELQRKISEKIQAKMHQAELAHQLDPQRIAQEVTLLLEKSDISEEITRLEEHLTQYSQMLHSKDAHGKSLDFYTQELLREVNTIGSKSHLSKLTQLVVEAKTLIERLREQVQNIE